MRSKKKFATMAEISAKYAARSRKSEWLLIDVAADEPVANTGDCTLAEATAYFLSLYGAEMSKYRIEENVPMTTAEFLKRMF